MEETKKKSLMDRFLNTVEVAGNKLPDPATLFILLACIVLVLSAVFASMGAEAVHPGTHKVIKVVNLLSVDGLRMIWSKAVSNFSGFAPLGMVLVCVIGAGVAEKSGFLAAFMQKILGARLRRSSPSRSFLSASMAMSQAMRHSSSCRLWPVSSSSAWGVTRSSVYSAPLRASQPASVRI